MYPCFPGCEVVYYCTCTTALRFVTKHTTSQSLASSIANADKTAEKDFILC